MIGGFRRSEMQFWRENADPCRTVMRSDDGGDALCQREDAKRAPSRFPFAHCQYRYPSPRRSDRFAVRPTPPFATGGNCPFDSAFQIPVVKHRKIADSAPYKTNHYKGSNTCVISVSFSRPWPLRACRPVWTAILNVAWPALRLVPSLPTRWAATRSRALSSVVPLARFATKSQRPAAKLIPPSGVVNNLNRRSGLWPRGGGFAFEGLTPCSRKS